MPFLLHGPFAGHHCLLFNQATGAVRVQLFGILSMLIVLFRRYILLILSFHLVVCDHQTALGLGQAIHD
jgi:hypothetical protein